MDLSGGNRSLPSNRIKKHDCTPFRIPRMTERTAAYRSHFWRGYSGEQSAVFKLTTETAQSSAENAKHPDALRESPNRRQRCRAGGQSGMRTGRAKAEWSELPHPPSPSKRSPAKRVRFEKEEGGSGYAAFTALTETGKAEWSELLLTRKGCGQSGIGTVPPSPHRGLPGNSKYRRKTTCRSPTPLPIC